MACGAWWAAVYEVAQSRTQLKRLSSSSSRSTEAMLLPKHSKAMSYSEGISVNSINIRSFALD